MKKALILPYVLILFSCASAPPPPARTILASELAQMKKEFSSSRTSHKPMSEMLPLAISFQRGDRVPVNLFIQSNFVRTPTEAPAAEIIVEHPFTMIMYADRKPLFIFEDGTQHDIDGFSGAIKINVSAAPEAVPLSLGVIVISE